MIKSNYRIGSKLMCSHLVANCCNAVPSGNKWVLCSVFQPITTRWLWWVPEDFHNVRIKIFFIIFLLLDRLCTPVFVSYNTCMC